MVAATTQSRPRRSMVRHPRFIAGERVRFAEGSTTGTGVVDAATDDYSIIWIWTDGGLGRRMFFQGCGSIISSLKDQQE
ncbi:hypothetical protein ABIB27_000678 [Arthrobacter sp. UYEF21]